MAYVPEADADIVMNLLYFFGLYMDGFLVLCSVTLCRWLMQSTEAGMCMCTAYLGIFFLKQAQHNIALGLLRKDNMIDNTKEPTEL